MTSKDDLLVVGYMIGRFEGHFGHCRLSDDTLIKILNSSNVKYNRGLKAVRRALNKMFEPRPKIALTEKDCLDSNLDALVDVPVDFIEGYGLGRIEELSGKSYTDDDRERKGVRGLAEDYTFAYMRSFWDETWLNTEKYKER